ncbi:hypothetical protein [uncultured Paludibaculum sp.]|uniref:hypothetical protein n=1 Tax=uncultured Paludibaculum sp. TaxID=1765020 RepID=UPI002AAB6982|nr:hypothetical protein [uncultured Paludibaculum sp.]
MWNDVSQQLAHILSHNVFDCLLRTPSYTSMLRKGGLPPPFTQYLKHTPPPFPPSYEGTCQTFAQLIVSQVKQLGCLAEDDTLRAEIIHGPVRLYRAMSSRQKGPEPDDLRRNTAYIGDWWFSEELLESCILHCRALMQERNRNPAVTDMTPDRCLRVQLRRRLAIRLDWNTIKALRRLVLASNESIPVITGRGVPMEIITPRADARRFPDRALPVARQLLPGGDRQIWMPWTPQKSIQLWAPKGGFTPNARL